MNNTYSQAESRRIDIETATAVSLEVAVGDRIRCVRGKIWLTQEGDSRDHYLVGGVSFCVDHKGRAVLDAIGRQDEAVATYEAGLKRCPDSQILQEGLAPIRRERARRIFKVIPGGRS